MIKFDMHIHFDFFPSMLKTMDYYNSSKIFSIFATLSPNVFLKYKRKNIETDYIKLSLGAHPCYLEDFTFKHNEFLAAVAHTKYISEVGLDFSRDYVQNKRHQLDVFDFICKNTTNKMLVIHSRKAEKEVYDILRKYGNKYIVMHWYTGNIENFKLLIKLGAYFSINHKMLLSKKTKSFIELLPLDRVLVETDAPFTINDDNDFNYDKHYMSIVDYLTKAYNLNEENIKNQLSKNFYKLVVDVNASNM